MIRTRFNPRASVAESPFAEISPEGPPDKPSAWIQTGSEALSGSKSAVFILLLGSTDLLGFRVRVAQSQYRSDGLPSFFSHAALLLREAGKLSLLHVPLIPSEPGAVPRRNGIEEGTLASLDAQTGLYANFALLHVKDVKVADIRTAATNLQHARLAEDLVSPIPAWLAFSWLCAGQHNPLLSGIGLPSAMFVEACYAACNVDIVPGISQRIICPEAIWQGARFWSASLPGAHGQFELRQRYAAASLDFDPERPPRGDERPPARKTKKG